MKGTDDVCVWKHSVNCKALSTCWGYFFFLITAPNNGHPGPINRLGERATGATSSELMVEAPRASPTETGTEETIDKLT